MDLVSLTEALWICKTALSDIYTTNQPIQATRNYSKILNNLYLGNASTEITDLQSLNINSKINFAKDTIITFPNLTSDIIFDLEDSPTQFIYDLFDKVNDIIFKETITHNRNIYLHCSMGISRSPTFILAYLIKHCQKTLFEAIKLLKLQRSCIYPNDGFLVQLILYENQIYKNQSQNITLENFNKTMEMLGLIPDLTNINLTEEFRKLDLPKEWKNLYQLGFSSYPFI